VSRAVQKRLLDVRVLAGETASAGYVQRLRLQRAVLKLQRAVAAEAGLPLPVRLTDRLDETTAAAAVSNRLAESARKICQPSEALDRRWIEEWDELGGLVSQLEAEFVRAALV